MYVEHMVLLCRELHRVLRDDGTMWLNLGDCYANSRAGWTAQRYADEERDDRTFRDKPFNTFAPKGRHTHGGVTPTNNGFRSIDWGYRVAALTGGDFARGKGSKHDRRRKGSNRAQRGDGNDGIAYGPMVQPNRDIAQPGLKQKDLCGIPWRVALALQDDGWYLRRDIIWHKKNPMPESVYDRPTTAHEYLFLFSKSGDTLCWRHQDGRWVYEKPEPDWRWRHRTTRQVVDHDPGDKKKWFRFNLWRGYDYYYDAFAIMEPSSPDSHARAARSRAKEHKHSNGSDLSGKPHGIAINAPVAGRYPEPSGWDTGEGHHGSVHRDGRRQDEKRALPAEWKQGGPNSRFHKDFVPSERKLSPKDAGREEQGLKVADRMGGGAGWRENGARKSAAHAGTYANQDGPRPRNNENWDMHWSTADRAAMRNKRSVWPIATKAYKEAHFATFPPALIEPCILAGCPKGGVVLDPCAGAGTTGYVAELHGRNSILIEINPTYAKMAEARVAVLKMGPEQQKRADIKRSGKLQTTRGLPLFSRRTAVTRDSTKPKEAHHANSSHQVRS
jgi:hypothetical protein